MKIINSQPTKINEVNKVVKDLYSITKKTKGDKASKEEIYEIIKYNKKQYYYNCLSNQAYDLENMNLNQFRRRKLIFIE